MRWLADRPPQCRLACYRLLAEIERLRIGLFRNINNNGGRYNPGNPRSGLFTIVANY